jgi:nucleoid DNA-binding protein
MDKRELATIVAHRTSLSRADVEFVIGHTVEAIKEAMLRGETVSLAGFGEFGAKDYPAQRFVHLRTKVPYIKAPRRVPALKLYDSFRERFQS